MKRQDPKNIREKLKAERAASGLPELRENVAYDAARAEYLGGKKRRQKPTSAPATRSCESAASIPSATRTRSFGSWTRRR